MFSASVPLSRYSGRGVGGEGQGLGTTAPSPLPLSRSGGRGELGLDPATFTVSNLGMLGVDSFTAIIHPPEAAILAVGAVSKQPVATPEGSVQISDMMHTALSADHRSIDGTLAARFLNHVKHGLENPQGLIDQL